MSNTKFFLTIMFSCIVISSIGLYIGFTNMQNKNLNKLIQNNIDNADLIDAPQEAPKFDVKVTEKTKIIYEYYYKQDDRIEIRQEDAPYFMYNKTYEDIKEQFIDWDIMQFEQNEIIMRKYVDAKSNQYYIVGLQDGYVAVFYKNNVNGTNLKEITDTSASVLPIEDQQRLLNGIEVEGEEDLIRILEDYGS